jgi:hypothetical protein
MLKTVQSLKNSIGEFAAGTALAPSITTVDDTNTGLFFPSADAIAFSNGGVETARIIANGNAGIGTSLPTAKLEVAGNVKTALNIVNSEVSISSLAEAQSYFAVSGFNVQNLSYNGTSIGLANTAASPVSNAAFFVGGFRPVLPKGWTGTVSLTATADAAGFATFVKIQTSVDGSTWVTRATAGTNTTLAYVESTPLTQSLFLRIQLESASGSNVSEIRCRFANLLVTGLFAETNNTFSSGVKYPRVNTLGLFTNNIERASVDGSGNLIQVVNTTAATLTTNQTLTFSIVDNSTLRISVRGSDGVTRTATLPLI